MQKPLTDFIDRLAAVLDQHGSDEERLLPQVRDLMRELVARDDWLDDARAQPHPQHYQQYLLHADPQERFSVVSFVWGPGQATPVHDHTVWGVIGVLRGAEISQPYRMAADGRPVPGGKEERLARGEVAVVSPEVGDVHQVRNAHEDRVSVSIHVYGGNIGLIRRHVYPLQGGPRREFVSGYSVPT